MFDREQAIAGWRNRMLSAGMTDADSLDELESHLCDALQELERSGMNSPCAFEKAVQQIGDSRQLKVEFDKVRTFETTLEAMKTLFLTLAGIPSAQTAGNSSVSQPTPAVEPRWVTYSRAALFLLPTLAMWGFTLQFLAPKMNYICREAGFAGFSLVHAALSVSYHWFPFCMAIAALLVLMEWRVAQWPRYRRAIVSIGAMVLNALVLISIIAMFVAVLVAAPTLFPAK